MIAGLELNWRLPNFGVSQDIITSAIISIITRITRATILTVVADMLDLTRYFAME